MSDSTAAELLELRDAVRGVLGTRDATAAAEPDPTWRDRWPAVAAVGVLGFAAAAHAGGFDAEIPAALVAGRELGAALHGAPYAGAVAATALVSRDLRADARDDVVDAILTGRHVPTLGFLDPGARTAGNRVSGTARLVDGAPASDSIVLLGPEGAAPVWVRPGEGVTVGSADGFDVTRACADVHLVDAPAEPVAVGAETVAWARGIHGLLLAADALGGVERMLNRTVDYAKERVAFGKPIGGFQAVQHRLVDHTVRVRGLTLLCEAAAGALATHAPDAARAALLAEAATARAALTVLHDLLQLTGAIAFTWEHGLHLYERRAHLDARLGRNPRRALAGLAALEGWTS